MAADDFNKDDRPDIVVANRMSNTVGILLEYANRAIAYKTTLKMVEGLRPQSFVITDFNLNDQMDIAVANYGSNSVGIFFGYNNYSFTQSDHLSHRF